MDSFSQQGYREELASSSSQPSLFSNCAPRQLTDVSPVVFLKADVTQLSAAMASAFEQLRASFERLIDDYWLKSGYVFRQRRFGLFSIDTTTRSVSKLPQRAFFQTSEVNSYAGGVKREFEPLEEQSAANPFLHQLMWDVYETLPPLRAAASRYWEIGVHLVRVIARPGQPGDPAPEGMHRDGHAFTSIALMNRIGVEGGLSRFAGKDGTIFCERAMMEPIEVVVFDDAHGLHDVTSITARGAQVGVRDTCGFSLNPM
jgi:hypothetical protein